MQSLMKRFKEHDINIFILCIHWFLKIKSNTKMTIDFEIYILPRSKWLFLVWMKWTKFKSTDSHVIFSPLIISKYFSINVLID